MKRGGREAVMQQIRTETEGKNEDDKGELRVISVLLFHTLSQLPLVSPLERLAYQGSQRPA